MLLAMALLQMGSAHAITTSQQCNVRGALSRTTGLLCPQHVFSHQDAPFLVAPVKSECLPARDGAGTATWSTLTCMGDTDATLTTGFRSATCDEHVHELVTEEILGEVRFSLWRHRVLFPKALWNMRTAGPRQCTLEPLSSVARCVNRLAATDLSIGLFLCRGHRRVHFCAALSGGGVGVLRWRRLLRCRAALS